MISDILSAIVVYVLVWWLVFFCTLPMGIETQAKNTDGSMPGAPKKAGIKRKAILASVISFVIWAIIEVIIHLHLISYRDIADQMRM